MTQISESKLTAIKLVAVLVVGIVIMLYVVEWASNKMRPAAANAVVTLSTNAMSQMSSNMTATVRAGIEVALEHIRAEMAHTTNEVDLLNLREAEKTLTNVLARP